jgi:uncharacterized phage protein (TIGR02220 family)
MYRTIHAQFWTDPKVRQLSREGKLLFLYLITNPHTHLCGLYYLPQELVRKETGIPNTLCDTLYDTLSEMNLSHHDQNTETIFVTKMFSYQGRGEKNERAAANHLITLHQCSLIHRFFRVYPTVLPYWKGYPIDTLSDTLSDTPSESGKRCPSVPVPVSDLLTNQDSDLRSKSYTNGRNYREEAKVVLGFLNEKTGKKFRANDTNLEFVIARLKSGVDVQTCKTLIARKVRDWTPKPEMVPYLRPETLFNKTKFETYLAEVSS